MPISETLNTAGQVSSAIHLPIGKTATWALTSAGLTGYVTIERGETPAAFSIVRLVAPGDTNQFSGPGYFRFRLGAKAGAESVNVSIIEDDDVVLNVPNTDGSGDVLTVRDSGIQMPAGPSGSGMVERPLKDKLAEIVSVKDFGARGNGSVDDTASFAAAFSAGVKNVHIPAGTYRLSGSIQIPMGTCVSTDGYASELQFYGLTASTDGLVITESASYDHTVIEKITIRTMDANGRYGIVTPSSAGLFANKRPQFFIDAFFIGEDKSKTIFTYGWSEMVRIGDCRGGRVNVVGFGRYNPTLADGGQADDIGVRLTSNTGNIGLTLKLTISNTRRPLVLSNGTEGFSLQDGSELVGCWIGVDSDAASEPGGFISNTHINCNSRGLKLTNRTEMNIANLSVYRAGSFFDHTGEWAAIEASGCTFNIRNVTVAHATTLVAGSGPVGVKLTTCSGTLDGLDCRFASAVPASTGVLVDDCDDFLIDNCAFLETVTLYSVINSSTDIHIGATTTRGSHAVTTTKYNIGAGIDRKRIYIDKRDVTDLSGLYTNNASVSAAGSINLVSGTASPTQVFTFTAGAGVYTYDIDLDEAQAVVGDIFTIKVNMPSSTNPTVRIRRKTGAFVMSSINTATARRLICGYIFTGTSFEELYVFESIEATY